MSTALVVAFILCGLQQVVHAQENSTSIDAVTSTSISTTTEAPPDVTNITTDYCQAGLCRSMVKHIGCRNKGELNRLCSPNATLVNLTGLRDFILDEHNFLRNLLASGKMESFPLPDRMATLQWHPELEHLATLNVKQCSFKRDPCHNTPEFRNSGQNLALFELKQMENQTDAFLLKEAINGWWNQSDNATVDQIQHFPKGKPGEWVFFSLFLNSWLIFLTFPSLINNFAVMARDNNTFVGCAALRFEKPPGNNQFLLACNYAGNFVINWPLYREKSQGCQAADLRFSALCKPGEQYQEDPVEETTTMKSNFWRSVRG
ncbi:hypothetical protein KR009_012050 [Drosophila setifemur]|nr:hypothetical protein KR009_012050 [Drosophila setifemur]